MTDIIVSKIYNILNIEIFFIKYVFIIKGYFSLLMNIVFTGLVPIHLAAIGNHPEIIAQLANKGCDINIQVYKYIFQH